MQVIVAEAVADVEDPPDALLTITILALSARAVVAAKIERTNPIDAILIMVLLPKRSRATRQELELRAIEPRFGIGGIDVGQLLICTQ
jgi:hypothetical protein